jgi:thioredoxin reductase (NADPH)
MEEYDLVIIGGGPAGYSAGIYGARFNLKTLIITKLDGGLITTTHLVENYPGFPSISGQELANNLLEHVKANNVPILNDEVSSINKKGKEFIIKTQILEKELKTKSLIIATGSIHKHLGVKGEKEFAGKGVSYCATCDGNFFRNKTVGIIGGGNVAVKDAMVLGQLAKKVYMFVRSTIKAEPINVGYLKKYKNIEIIEGVNVKEITGKNKVESVKLDKKINSSNQVNLDGIFIAIGQMPQSSLAKDLDIKLNSKKEIVVNREFETSIKGVMAAGDITNTNLKQAITASAQGAHAGYSAYNYVNKEF